MFCPSFQLFLGCCQWVPILVQHRLVCLLEFACQFLGHQVQVPQIPLSGCCLCLSSKVIDVVPLTLLDAPLYFSAHCCIPFPCLCLGCSCSAVVQHTFPSLLVSSLWMVSAEIHSCAMSSSCQGPLHMCRARGSCSAPTVFQCPSHRLLSALVAAGTCWKGGSGQLFCVSLFLSSPILYYVRVLLALVNLLRRSLTVVIRRW